MSMQQSVDAAVREGRLCYLEPLLPSDALRRTLLLGPELSRDLEYPFSDPRLARLWSDLESFVFGEVVVLDLEPFARGPATMRILDPPEAGIFELRSRDPSPGIRVFGVFVVRDVFVALEWRTRGKKVKYNNKPPLNAGEAEWDSAKQITLERFERALPGVSPLTGANVNDFISEDVVDGSDPR